MLHVCVCDPVHADPEPPTFLTPPSPSLTVLEGAPNATFTCLVRGHPPPAVTWTRQGTVLLSGHRYKVTSDGDTHSLLILNPQAEDAGDYVCHVHNTAGTVTDRCRLRVAEAGAGGANTHEDTAGFTQQTIPPPLQISLKSALNTTTTTAITTTSTTRLSRVSVKRSPTWHGTSSVPAFGVGIRMGSVRKRRDWFEQRASPSPDRTSPLGSRVPRLSALSVDRRERHTASGDRVPPSEAKEGQTAGSCDGLSPPPPLGTVDGETASRDFLAPAIYQFKTDSSPVDDGDDKVKSQFSSRTTSPRPVSPSQPGLGAEKDAGNGADISHLPESHPSTDRAITTDVSSFSPRDPKRQQSDKRSARSSERTEQRPTDYSDNLRTQSPGRMDFRSVLKSRQIQADSPKQQQEHLPKTDFRSVLRKTRAEMSSTVRRLFPDQTHKADSARTADGQQSASDIGDDVSQCVDRAKTESRHTGNNKQLTVGTVGETQSTAVPPGTYAAEPVGTIPESTKHRYFTTARATITLSAPAPDTTSSSCSRSRQKNAQGERGGDVVSRESGGYVDWEAPKVVRGLEDHTVCYGGQVVMRCTVSGQPQPVIVWSLNSKVIKPSRFFQLSYQDPHAQLLVAEAFSEDEGEYTCTATNSVGTDSSSCYLTVEGVSKRSSGSREVCDVSKVSASLPSLPTSGNESSISDITEMMLPPASDAAPKTSELDAASAQGQPMNGASRCEVSGHLPVAAEASLAAAGGVVMDPYLKSQDQGPLNPSGRKTKVVLTSGRKFEDHYECGRELGRGKFGSVYECREKQTGAVVAAKVLKAVGKARKQDVRREVEVMNVLRHPTLLLLHDAFEADRLMVIVTEFVGGGELLERVCNEQYVLTERDCVHFLRQLCDGLVYMHGQGVLHLDLKPNNILCVDLHSTRIKIIDFGLARFYAPGDSLHVLFGTPEFVAPEVISYDEISFATDMWSIGVITYILLSGLSPFLGDDDAETLANVTRGEYDFDDDCFDVISEDAKEFIYSLLLKQKEKRMTADQCRRHVWLTRPDEHLGSRRLNTDNLRSFVEAHRKLWHKAGQAIIATNRLLKTATGNKLTPGDSTTISTTL